jgi:hypothetical protein
LIPHRNTTLHNDFRDDDFVKRFKREVEDFVTLKEEINLFLMMFPLSYGLTEINNICEGNW